MYLNECLLFVGGFCQSRESDGILSVYAVIRTGHQRLL